MIKCNNCFISDEGITLLLVMIELSGRVSMCYMFDVYDVSLCLMCCYV